MVTSGHVTKMAITSFDPPLPNTTCYMQTSCFIEPGLLPMEVLHCGNRDFRPFVLLWPWPWPDDLHIWTWPVFPGSTPDVQIWTFYVKAIESYRLTDRQDKQTRPKLYTTPLRGWSIQHIPQA